jgi:tail tube protein
MATGTGLDAQLMFAAESTWGTAVTPTRAIEFNEESLEFAPTWLEPESLRVGTIFKRASRIKQSRKSVEGDATFDVLTKGMGLLVKHMLGSAVSTPTLINGTSYKQVHTPSGFVGLGLTTQVGRPEPSGTVRAFTYSGCKVMSWEFNLEDGSTPNLKLSFLGRQESTATALATASFLSGAASFDFSQATIKLGGTPSTSAGETTIASGVAATTVIRSISISGENPMADERFGIGNAGLRSEPLQNDIPTITGSLDAEFNKTELYDLFSANTTVALQLDLTGAIVSGSNNYLFSFILPAVKLKKAAPAVGGPDVVSMSTDFEAYSNEADPVIQIKIVSDESSSI